MVPIYIGTLTITTILATILQLHMDINCNTTETKQLYFESKQDKLGMFMNSAYACNVVLAINVVQQGAYSFGKVMTM